LFEQKEEFRDEETSSKYLQMHKVEIGSAKEAPTMILVAEYDELWMTLSLRGQKKILTDIAPYRNHVASIVKPDDGINSLN